MYFQPYYSPYFLPFLPPPWNYESTQPTSPHTLSLPTENYFEKAIAVNNFHQQNQSKPTPVLQKPRQSLYSLTLRPKPQKRQSKAESKTQSLKNRSQQNNSLYQNVNSIGKQKYLQDQRSSNKRKIKTNCISNILRLFLRRISLRCPQFESLISKIIQKNKIEVTTSAFLVWLDEQEVNHRIYLTPDAVKKYFNGNQSFADCYKIMRILLEYFIKNQGVLCYITSKKARRQNLLNNLQSLRYILKGVFERRAQ